MSPRSTPRGVPRSSPPGTAASSPASRPCRSSRSSSASSGGFGREVVETAHPVLDEAVAQLEAFLADRRRAFDLPIDLSDRPAWDQAVLQAVCDVPWGTVASYAQIARAVDRPGAARATGGAIARSPIGIIVPCHRIITANGTLGGYGGDGFGTRLDHLRLKRELLLREGVDIPLPVP